MQETQQLEKRIETMFNNRKTWESLWQTVYEYIAPERALFTQGGQAKDPSSIAEHVYDSTAIDATERLTNLVISGLTPPWKKWFRLVPGPNINDDEAEQIRPMLDYVEDMVHNELRKSNFYQEMQPLITDRIVGGTGIISFWPPAGPGDGFQFKAIPLAECALEEDNQGNISAVARKVYMSFRDIMRSWPDGPSQIWREQNENAPDDPKHEVQMICAKDAAGQWQYVIRLAQDKQILKQDVKNYPVLYATRWSKIPGSPYGRGPGLRALADVRSLNKLKQLSLENAALAVSGVYTVVDDGVINPWTISITPGAMIPVFSNAPNERSIAPLESASNFDVSQWSMEYLRSSIQQIFLADQFGPLEKTPKSATEIRERTRIIAQELGATISRLQYEILTPIIQAIMQEMGNQDKIPPEIQIDGENINAEFVSRLAQAQWAEEEQNLVEYSQIVAEFGQIDPQAGLVLDIHSALREVGHLKGIPAKHFRTQQEIEQKMQQAAQAQQEMQAEGMDPQQQVHQEARPQGGQGGQGRQR